MPKNTASRTEEQLLAEIENLQARLDEAEESLCAIRNGEVDALVVSGTGGDRLFTLRGADHFYRVLIEEMSEGAVTLTAEGVIVYANRSFAEMVKAPLEKVIGSPIRAWIAPADQDQFQSLWTTGEDQKRHRELALTASDGTRVLVNLSMSGQLVNDRPDCTCLVATDLTEQKRREGIAATERSARELLAASEQSRLALLSMLEDQKRAEAALRLRESYLNAIFDNQPGLLWLKDADNRFLTVNRAFADSCGRSSPADLVGKTDFDIWPKELAQQYIADDASVIRNKTSINVEEPIADRGETKWFETFKTPILNDEGKVIGTTGCSRDITERRKNEEALRESEARLRAVMQTALDAIVSMDSAGNIVGWNGGAEKVFGYSESEITGQPLLLLLPSRFHERHLTGMARMMASGQRSVIGQTVELEGRRKDGGEFPLELSLAEWEVSGHQYFTAIIRDITGRKRAEEALRESESHYRMLFERNLAGVYRSTFDGLILDCNDAFAKMLGFQSREEMSSLPAPALDKNSSDRHEFIARLLKDGRLANFEELLRRRDGSPLWVLENVSLVEEGGGAVLEGTVIDITDWKKSQAERLLLNAAMDQAHDAIMVTNRQGDILYVNPAFEAITGYGREEVLGKHPNIIKSDVQDQPFYGRLWATITSGKTWSGRLVNKRKDGSLFTEQTIISPVLDETGAITAYVALKRDVTQEVELQRQLDGARTLETIGMITGGVAHEVRNPLNSIQIMAAVLEKKQGEDPDVRQCVAHIQEQVQRLSMLMKDLLLLGRPADLAGFAPCDLRQLANDAAWLAEEGVAGSDGRVRVRSDDPLPPVVGDSAKLTQVLINIIQNALTLSPEGTPVEVEAFLEGGMAQVRIRDRGPGIAEEFLPRLFQPFQSKRKGGTGLGLAIVQKIVADHGGSVRGANNEPGPGATFTVRLPVQG